MKKYLSVIWFLAVVFITLSSFEMDGSKKIDDKIHPKQKTSQKTIESTPIKEKTNLPFSNGLVSQNTLKLLPQIDSLHYTPLNTGFDFNFTNRTILKHLKTFNNQLPNINGFEVYYSEIDCYNTSDSSFKAMCDGFAGLNCGFLIIYNPSSKIAQMMNISNSYFIDSGVELAFEIDTNYKIKLSETGMTDGDIAPDGTMETDIYDISKYVVKINTDGSFHTQQIELP